jgi:quercetin dioxygenase-like cupin family protein
MRGIQRASAIAFGGLLLALSASRADVDPTAVEVTAPANVKWVKNSAGTSESAVLFGDPSKPGPYVMRIKWLPGNMSRPHTHATDRFFVVISGTWWVGSGTKFDPDSTVPAGPGSYVIHHANQPHYDGAKNEETVIQVWGIGPLTTQSVEQR